METFAINDRQRAQNHKERNLSVCVDVIQYQCYKNWLIHTRILFQCASSFVIFETLIGNHLKNHSFIHNIIIIIIIITITIKWVGIAQSV